jgi:quinol monooxygenase YgiN
MSAPSSERIMFATMIAQPGKRDELKAVFGPMFAQAATEQGTLHYTLIEGDEPDTLYFWEHYQSQSAMDAHMASDALAKIHQALGGLLVNGSVVLGTVVQKLR